MKKPAVAPARSSLPIAPFRVTVLPTAGAIPAGSPFGALAYWTRYGPSSEQVKTLAAEAARAEWPDRETTVLVAPLCRCGEPGAGWMLCPHHGSLSAGIVRETPAETYRADVRRRNRPDPARLAVLEWSPGRWWIVEQTGPDGSYTPIRGPMLRPAAIEAAESIRHWLYEIGTDGDYGAACDERSDGDPYLEPAERPPLPVVRL